MNIKERRRKEVDRVIKELSEMKKTGIIKRSITLNEESRYTPVVTDWTEFFNLWEENNNIPWNERN